MGPIDEGAPGEADGGPLVDRVRGRRVYFDTGVFIYALEGEPATQAQMLPLFAALDAGEVEVVTGELTLAEVLVVPYRTGDDEAARLYERVLAPRPHFSRVAATPDLWRAAARVRAGTALKLPDALHAATAEAEGCDLLVTGDRRLAKASPIPAALAV